METQLNELTQMMKALQAQNSMIQRTLNDNLATLHDVGVWRPKIDAKVDEMHQSITVLQQKVDSLASHPPASNAAMCDFDTEAINLTKSAAPHSTVTSPAISLPIGAGDETSKAYFGSPTSRGDPCYFPGPISPWQSLPWKFFEHFGSPPTRVLTPASLRFPRARKPRLLRPGGFPRGESRLRIFLQSRSR
jgi:hypothetical protein